MIELPVVSSSGKEIKPKCSFIYKQQSILSFARVEAIKDMAEASALSPLPRAICALTTFQFKVSNSSNSVVNVLFKGKELP